MEKFHLTHAALLGTWVCILSVTSVRIYHTSEHRKSGSVGDGDGVGETRPAFEIPNQSLATCHFRAASTDFRTRSHDIL